MACSRLPEIAVVREGLRQQAWRKRKEENPSFLNISENYVLHLWHLWQTKGVCSEIMLLRLNFLILFCDICDICDTIQPTFMTKPDPPEKKYQFCFSCPLFTVTISFSFIFETNNMELLCDFFLIRLALVPVVVSPLPSRQHIFCYIHFWILQ